jgi:hypothetical protein
MRGKQWRKTIIMPRSKQTNKVIIVIIIITIIIILIIIIIIELKEKSY